MKKILSYILVFCLVFTAVFNVLAENNQDHLEKIIADTAEYIYKTVPNPQVSSIGGEWAVFGLARSGYSVPDEYYQNYYKTVEEYVKQCNGKLSARKYTEYSRLILALTAIGKNPSDVAGYNLLTPLCDYEKTIAQGLNGAIWALIALDSNGYDMAYNSEARIQATRDMYVNYILECQLSEGGWSLSGKNSETRADIDITGMALSALSKYRNSVEVDSAIDRALAVLSEAQDENGGFSSWGSENSESTAQVITALCELGISVNDSRFVKNGKNLFDNMMDFYQQGGWFKNTKDIDKPNQMSSEQALCGLAAIKRSKDGKNTLYTLSDNITILEKNEDKSFGLTEKHKDIRYIDIIYQGKTFSDIQNHKNQPAIEELSARGIINGKTDDIFEPDAAMTRAEFAVIVTRALGLTEKSEAYFDDIARNDWYFGYINTAYYYGIVSGVSESEFNPNGTITREEAAAMVSRAAGLCGMNTAMDGIAVRNILAAFTDYVTVSEWAMGPVAFCYDKGIIEDDGIGILPKIPVTRAEVAQMLFNMMRKAELV